MSPIGPPPPPPHEGSDSPFMHPGAFGAAFYDVQPRGPVVSGRAQYLPPRTVLNCFPARRTGGTPPPASPPPPPLQTTVTTVGKNEITSKRGC